LDASPAEWNAALLAAPAPAVAAAGNAPASAAAERRDDARAVVKPRAVAS
jgi:hypothetical protein